MYVKLSTSQCTCMSNLVPASVHVYQTCSLMKLLMKKGFCIFRFHYI